MVRLSNDFRFKEKVPFNLRSNILNSRVVDAMLPIMVKHANI